MEHKTVGFEVVNKDSTGGEIIISTPAVDRDRDRINPKGARVENYLKNPVVQWGHNYKDPWATIGKTTGLTVNEQGITAKFEFREPVNETDPMNVIKVLWNGGFVNTASIGFNPLKAEENDVGGLNFNDWDLLEWSLVPIPSNQEALRLAVKSLDKENLLVVLDKIEEKPVLQPVVAEPRINPQFVETLKQFVAAIKEEL